MDVIITLILMLAMGCFFYGPWQRQCEDWGRQRLFRIRDQIFDLAADGRIAFDDPIYKDIRQSMNTMIRFMHEMTWVKLAFISFMLRNENVDEWNKGNLESAVRKVADEQLQKDINKHLTDMGYVIAVVVVQRSVLLLAVFWTLNTLAKLCSFLGWVAVARKQITQRAYRHVLTVAQRDAEFAELGAMAASH